MVKHETAVRAESAPAPHESAQEAGLRYVSDSEPGLTRKASGKSFVYLKADGSRIKDDATLGRIKSLVIPPAWEDVWICRTANGHLQAVGRDARGRKQYRYHPEFRQSRESTKFEHMMAFAKSLPKIRKHIEQDLARRGLPREKVLAAVVHLLERTLIRIGNADYSKTNKSYGLTTLQDRHVRIDGSEVKFQFTGKSGKVWNLQLKDRRVARIVKECQDIPGQHLFQYLDDDGARQSISSGDVNGYLREITGQDITAKDFRTWAGTVLAAMALSELEEVDSAAKAKKNLRAAIEEVAKRLGNTPTVCRKCYIHPEITQTYLDGDLVLGVKREIERELKGNLSALSAEEAAVLALLHRRLRGAAKKAA